MLRIKPLSRVQIGRQTAGECTRRAFCFVFIDSRDLFNSFIGRAERSWFSFGSIHTTTGNILIQCRETRPFGVRRGPDDPRSGDTRHGDSRIKAITGVEKLRIYDLYS